MTDYKNVPKHFEKIMRPNCAYITFRKDEAFQAALKMSLEKKTSLNYRGETLKMRRALQPTNILWENFEFTKKERQVRWAAVFCSILIAGILYFLFAAFALQL